MQKALCGLFSIRFFFSFIRRHVKLRPGNASDAQALAGLIASFQREITVHPDGIGAERYLASVSSEALRSYLESSRYVYIVAEREEELLGFIALRDGNHVFHMFVARDQQRQGVARRLWQEAKAREQRATAPSQFTVNSSLGAVPIYRAFGFESTGEVTSMNGISFMPMRLASTGNEA